MVKEAVICAAMQPLCELDGGLGEIQMSPSLNRLRVIQVLSKHYIMLTEFCWYIEY